MPLEFDWYGRYPEIWYVNQYQMKQGMYQYRQPVKRSELPLLPLWA